MLLSLLPKEFFGQKLAFRIVVKQFLLGPIILISDFAISSYHNCQAAWSENQLLNFVFEAGIDYIQGAFNSRLDELIFIFWDTWWDRRGHMDNIFHTL